MIEYVYKTEVYCTLKIEGTHCWKDCPFDEVAYLRDPHRHLFGIKAWVVVDHADRDCEFVKLKHDIEDYIMLRYYDTEQHLCTFGSMSCEMIAKILIDEFNLSKCQIDEDSENGALVERKERVRITS